MNRARMTALKRDLQRVMTPAEEGVLHGISGSDLRRVRDEVLTRLQEPHEHDLHRLADDGGPATD